MDPSPMAPTEPARLVSWNPATGEVLGELSCDGPEAVREAVRQARAAQGAWAAQGFAGRRLALLAWRDQLVQRREAIARLVQQEVGKPYPEALAELATACDFLVHFAEESEGILAPVQVGSRNPLLAVRSAEVHCVPLGVVAIISPWNFPLLLTVAEAAMALAAGNAVVMKASEHCPLVGRALAEAAWAAPLPPGVVGLVTGAGPTGAALASAKVDRVCFTGSVATGLQVAAAAARRLVPSTLELGGKDPAIVRHDAKLSHAVPGVCWAAFTNAGQVCASTERLLLDERIAGPFLQALEAQVRALRWGPTHPEAYEVGPMVCEAFRARLHAQVEEALARGATLHCGGVIPEGPGWHYPPTLISQVPEDCALWQEESFGPVLPVRVIAGGDEALVAAANANDFGLSATLWTEDLRTGQALARRLEAGTVWVNTGLASYGNPSVPRGGWKASGLGKIGGPWGLHEMVRHQAIEVSGTAWRKPWWYPMRGAMGPLMEGILLTIHGPTLASRARGAWLAARAWFRG